ncbi:MAG: FimV/HubP family polar landmark protein, partial [Pseudomonadota bacterium]
AQLRLLLGLWLSTVAGLVHAVTLGPIDTQSALYQKFEAEVAISNLGSVDPLQLQASLAGSADFDRMGVERFFFLSELRFEVVRRGKDYVIEISSPRVITEPYLDFVVELAWRGGRMLRNYTVLLDPPGRPVRSASAPAPEPTVASAPAPAERADAAPREGRVYGPTRARDTLWKIATVTRENEQITVYQQMIGIKRLNPDAFVDDNINLLKRGQVLKLPTVSQADALDHNAAVAQTQVESTVWQARREVVETAPTPEPETVGRLTIVTDTAPAVTQSEAQAADETVPEALVATVVPVNAADATVAEAATTEAKPMTMADLPAPLREQVEELDASIAVRDREIAALQTQIEQMRAELEQFTAAQAAEPIPAQRQGFLLNWLPPLLWFLLVFGAIYWIVQRTRMAPARPESA